MIIGCNHNGQACDSFMAYFMNKRRISVLTAARIQLTALIYFIGKTMGIILTKRPIDNRKKCTGTITEIKDSFLLGSKTQFSSELKVGDYVRIHGTIFDFPVTEIVDDAKIKVKVSLDLIDPTNKRSKDWEIKIQGMEFDVMPKEDQSGVYLEVDKALHDGKILFMFPEGASHDNHTMIPLKPGMAIFNWNAIKKGFKVPIICVGITWYDPAKWRSKVVINISAPLEIEYDESQGFNEKTRKEYTANTMKKIKSKMEEMKVNAESSKSFKTISFIKSLIIDKTLKNKGNLDHECFKSLANVFDSLSEQQETIKMTEKITDFKKTAKLNQMTLSNLKNKSRLLKSNLVLNAIILLIYSVLVI